jgi:hypothetical protein
LREYRTDEWVTSRMSAELDRSPGPSAVFLGAAMAKGMASSSANTGKTRRVKFIAFYDPESRRAGI